MPALTSTEFLELVRKSGLVEQQRLDTWLAAQRATLPADPTAVAERLRRDGLLTRLQVKYLLEGRHKGFFIAGKYKLLDLLGAGGMGSVYLCEHIRLRVPVALKMLPTAKTSDPEALERFNREARASASLNHPNILRGHDVDSDGRMHFIVMEYVEGVNLQSLVEEVGPLAPERAANYIRQAALGLQHAHERGWVHRDIKPSNLLVDRVGTVKVLDMGLARLMRDTDQLTQQFNEQSVLGTADYLAPEQCVDSHGVDVRADIYSFGCTLYYLLSGRPPFGDATATQKLLWHQVRSPEPVRNRRPEVPEGLAVVVARMMAKDPGARYQTPVEVAVALAPWAASAPIPLADAELPQRSSGFDDSSMGNERASQSAPDGSALRPTPTPGGAPTNGASPAPAGGGKASGPSSDISFTVNQSPQYSRSFSSRSAVTAMLIRPVRKRWVWVALALSLAGVTLIAWLVFLRQTSDPLQGVLPAVTVDAADEERSLFVAAHIYQVQVTIRSDDGSTRQVIRRAYDSVKSALKVAKDGDHILIVDPDFAETLEVTDASAVPSRITIEGRAPQGAVVWRPSRDERGKPVLSLNGVNGWTISHCLLDGGNSTPEVVIVRGRCPSLTLTDLYVKGHTRAAVALHSCAGEADEPLRISRVRVDSPAGGNAEACLLLEAGGSETRHVVIQDCRLQGPAKAGLRVTGPAAYVDLRQTRFHLLAEAVSFTARTKEKALPRLRVNVTSNTFASVGTAFRLEALPPEDKDQENRLVIRNNLFHKANKTFVIDEVIDSARARRLFPQFEGNVQDNASGVQGTLFLPVRTLDFPDLPTDDDDRKFLRYPATSPLNQAGANRAPVGVAPAS